MVAEALVAEVLVAEALVAEVLVAEALVAEVLVAEALVAEALVAEALVAEALVAESFNDPAGPMCNNSMKIKTHGHNGLIKTIDDRELWRRCVRQHARLLIMMISATTWRFILWRESHAKINHCDVIMLPPFYAKFWMNHFWIKTFS